MVIRESFGVFMSHGDTVLHLRQPSSLESEVKRSRELLEQSAKGKAVMWDSETECNTIHSRDGISRCEQLPVFGQNVVFPNAFKSSEVSAGKMSLAETIHPHERADREPNMTEPKTPSPEPGELRVPKCKEFPHTSV